MEKASLRSRAVDEPADDRSELPEAAIRAQLDRILRSGEFSASKRVRQFLRYIVEKTLQGDAARIKAYTIAIDVFGRDRDFDLQNDPIVRMRRGVCGVLWNDTIFSPEPWTLS